MTTLRKFNRREEDKLLEECKALPVGKLMRPIPIDGFVSKDPYENLAFDFLNDFTPEEIIDLCKDFKMLHTFDTDINFVVDDTIMPCISDILPSSLKYTIHFDVYKFVVNRVVISIVWCHGLAVNSMLEDMLDRHRYISRYWMYIITSDGKKHFETIFTPSQWGHILDHAKTTLKKRASEIQKNRTDEIENLRNCVDEIESLKNISKSVKQ